MKDLEEIREMKTYKHLFEKVVETENIKLAIWNASKGKRDRKDVAKILSDIENQVKVIRQTLINDQYIPGCKKEETINEGSNKKARRIRKPDFEYDQIVHHAIIQILAPIFQKGMYEYVCGSVPKRGMHSGKRAIQRWIRNDTKNTKYCLKMDIRHFYQSVDTGILKEKLKRKIQDDRMLNLLFRVIDSCDTGLPLGYYTSQWFANFLLQEMDHYIKEQLYATYYLRYMDDMVIFGSNKKKLHKMQIVIEKYLNVNLHLKMKQNWQVFRMKYTGKDLKEKGRALDFMGFYFFRCKTILRKSSMLAVVRKARKIRKKQCPTWHDAASMLSHMGKFKHTDTRNVYERLIKPYADIKKLKKLVSKHQRKVNQYAKSRIQKTSGLHARSTA